MKKIVLALCIAATIASIVAAQDAIVVDMKMASLDDFAQAIAADPMRFMDSAIEARSMIAQSLAFRDNDHPFTWPSPFFLHANAMMIVQSDAMLGSNVQFWFKAKDGDLEAIAFVKRMKNAPAVAITIDCLKGYVSRPSGIQNMPFVVVITELLYGGKQYSGEFTDELNN